MKKQETFTDMEYSCRKKKTRREEFLEIMDEIIPWEEWVDVIVPHYPSGKRGRPPMGIAAALEALAAKQTAQEAAQEDIMMAMAELAGLLVASTEGGV